MFPEIVRFSTLEKALVERLQEKSELILQILDQNQRELGRNCYIVGFYAFGF